MAERYVQLSKAYGNSTSVPELGITKALILLALPEAERETFINEPHEIGGRMLGVREMTTWEIRKAVRSQCSPVVKSGETYKTFQPIRKDSVRNLYNEKQDMLLDLAEDLNSEINYAKTHLDCIISLLAEQNYNVETYDRLTKKMQLLQKKIRA